MKIAVDAMGGDHAPGEIVQGAVKSVLNNVGADIMLVGRKEVIESNISNLPPGASLQIINASQTISMSEEPVKAVRKKRDSSISRSMALLKTGEVDAFVSAGNTGAVVASAMFMTKRLEGVKRPGIAISFPSDTEKGVCVLIDGGASVKCRPINLLQYGVMGSIYSQYVIGVKNPRVGLVNVGGEDVKGNSLVKEARGLLQDSPLNFVGSVEGQEIFEGTCDVAVCDGFVGNVMLKVTEGMGEGMLRWLKQSVESYIASGGDKEVAKAFFDRQNTIGNYSEYGGAPLLGIDGVCIICHGRSDANAIYNAIKVAKKVAENRVNEKIVESLRALGLRWRLRRFFDRERE